MSEERSLESTILDLAKKRIEDKVREEYEKLQYDFLLYKDKFWEFPINFTYYDKDNNPIEIDLFNFFYQYKEFVIKTVSKLKLAEFKGSTARQLVENVLDDMFIQK